MFRNGELFVHLIKFPQGEVRITAIALVDQQSLKLWDVDITSIGGRQLNIGIRGVRLLIAELCALAIAEGFNAVILIGFRVSGANPGRDVDLVLRCAAH
jgi:hypothetical protein